MSYGRGDFGESLSGSDGNTTGSGGYSQTGTSSSNMDYSRLTSVVASNITKISQNNKQINRLTQFVGTEDDNSSIREELQQRQQTARKLCKDTERFLKELKSLPHPDQESEKRQRRVMLTKLASSFSNCLNEFQKAQREALDIAQRYQPGNQAEGNALINMENTTGQVQVQQQLSQEGYAAMQEREGAIAQLEVQESSLQRELREQEASEMRKLESDINTMADVFAETHKLVNEQGEIVETIEQNIEHAVVDIQQGNVELRGARDNQRSARKKKFVLAGICLIFILVLFLIIYFSFPSSD